MGKSSAPTPSYAGLLVAQQAAANAGMDQTQGQTAYNYGIGQVANATPTVTQAANTSLGAQGNAANLATAQGNEYTSSVLPLQTAYNTAAQNYDTPGQEQIAASTAEANNAEQFNQARDASQRALEGFGVDPSSTRYAALDIGSRTQQAAAGAAAGNQAIQNTKTTGLGLQANALGLGNTTGSLANGSTAASTGAGSAASTGVTGLANTGISAATAPASYYSAANGALGTAASAIGNYNSAQMNAYQAQQQATSGIGTGLGALAGLAGAAMLAEGGDVGGNTGQMSPGVTPGGAIPAHASPSGGRGTDDVPARLTAGEFVIPKDVVEWQGLKAMYGNIDKARQERSDTEQNTQAKPQMRSAIPTSPTFVSRPGGGGSRPAIPTAA